MNSLPVQSDLKLLLASVCFLVLVVAMPGMAFAECPEGKSEIILVTPSGKLKTMCVNDAAVPGIENAAENSAGTILPAICPCFVASDLALYEADPGLACIGDSLHIECWIRETEPDPKVCDPDPVPCIPPCISMADFSADTQFLRCESLENAVLAVPFSNGKPQCDLERLEYCKAANGGEACECRDLSAEQANACFLILEQHLDVDCSAP